MNIPRTRGIFCVGWNILKAGIDGTIGHVACELFLWMLDFFEEL